MSNMSYCRFENTASDLSDCEEHIKDHLTGDHEPPARDRLIATCKKILEAVGYSVSGEIDEDAFETESDEDDDND